MDTTTNHEPVARRFTTANPVEFDLHNLDDERVLYITDDDRQLQTLILELGNTSPRDIEFQSPDREPKPKDLEGREIDWEHWMAGRDLYHLQLSFRPGVLSETTKRYLKHPAMRMAILIEGWDLKYDPDPTDLTDWVSLLWVGEERQGILIQEIEKGPHPSDFDALMEEFRKTPGSVAPSDVRANCLVKQATRYLVLPKLSAGAGGGVRGTRIHLNYRHLLYQDRAERVPDGTRTQFLNIVNHQGNQYIPLHAGFVGSATVLNDGKTSNELTLRIINTSESETIVFSKRPTSCFSFYVDTEDDHETQEWALGESGELSDFTMTMIGSSPDWTRHSNDQGKRKIWRFEISSPAALRPGEHLDFKLTGIVTSSPNGYANLSVRYEDIPGYWDGQVVCLIEKAPLVHRLGHVGIGTDDPKNKLAVVGDKEQVAHFSRGDGGDACIVIETESAEAYVEFKNRQSPSVSWMAGMDDNDKFRIAPVTGEMDDSNAVLTLESTGDLQVKGRIQDKTGYVMPVGTVVAFAGTTAPEGWLLCNGQSVSGEKYADLAKVLGFSSVSFIVPNYEQKFLVGADGSREYTVGKPGGLASVELSQNQMPSHHHSGTTNWGDGAHKHTQQMTHRADNDDNDCATNNIGDPSCNYYQAWGGEISATGSDHQHQFSTNDVGGTQPHENRPPYVALNYIIKY